MFYGDRDAVKALTALDKREAIAYDTTSATSYCTLEVRTIPYYERGDVREGELEEAKTTTPASYEARLKPKLHRVQAESAC